MPQPGELYHYPNYVFPDGGQRDKFVLLMGKTRADDWILARTTTQPHGRSHNPPCYHGDPYPGFYINTAGGLLPKTTWVALDRLDDYDTRDFDTKAAQGKIALVGKLALNTFCQLLDCAIRAQDITAIQERAMRDLRAGLGCK
jgi:hypothetical protein